MKSKKFIGKNNFNRFERSKIPQEYSNYNKNLIVKEFMGYKLYQLLCPTPKVYVGKENNVISSIYSEKLDDVHGFLNYLNEDAKDEDKLKDKDFSFFDATKTFAKEDVKKKIQEVPNMGVVLFVSLLLNDRDVMGMSFTNLLIDKKTNQVVKIDPSEIDLKMSFKLFEEQILEASLKDEEFTKHSYRFRLSPLIGHVYKILSDTQLQAAYDAIHSIDETALLSCLNWTTFSLQDKNQGLSVEDKFENEIIVQNLMQRKKALLNLLREKIPQYQPKEISLNSFRQNNIFKDEDYFTKTTERMQSGNSQPYVFNKEKRLLHKQYCIEALKELTTESKEFLDKKCVGLIPESNEKCKTLNKAKEAYNSLQTRVSNFNDNTKFVTVNNAVLEYQKITKDLLKELDKDYSSLSNVKRAFCDFLKRFYYFFGVGNFKLSSKGVATQISENLRKTNILSAKVKKLEIEEQVIAIKPSKK